MKSIQWSGNPDRPLSGGWIALLVAVAIALAPGFLLTNTRTPARIEKNTRAHEGIAWVDERMLIDVNTADLDLLMELPGIGEVLALAILAEREIHGPFDSLYDLESIPGIGEKTLKSLEEFAIAA